MKREDRPKAGDDAFERLADLQRLGQALFEREAGRLARKHGVDHPRAQRVIRIAGGAQEILVAVEATRAAAPREVGAAPGETVVYGRVVSDDLKGVAKVEVTLEDTSGRVMRAAGTATTDARGCFTLRIPPTVAEKLAGKDHIITARVPGEEKIHRSAGTVRLGLNEAVEVDVSIGERTPLRRPQPPRGGRKRGDHLIEAPSQPDEPGRPKPVPRRSASA